MTFLLNITLGNEEMNSGANVALALNRIATSVTALGIEDFDVQLECALNKGVYDRNGNKVGHWEIK